MHREATVVKQSSVSVMSASISFAEYATKFAAVAGDFLLLACKILYISCCAMVRNILPKSKKDLCNEIVLVTGSAHGVGKELAIQIAKLGAKVVLWDINAVSTLINNHAKFYTLQIKAVVNGLLQKIGRQF